jgi:hypothetical protein
MRGRQTVCGVFFSRMNMARRMMTYEHMNCHLNLLGVLEKIWFRE